MPLYLGIICKLGYLLKNHEKLELSQDDMNLAFIPRYMGEIRVILRYLCNIKSSSLKSNNKGFLSTWYLENFYPKEEKVLKGHLLK
jgi:hypothetical protein